MTLDAVAWMRRGDVALYAGDVGDAFPPMDPQLAMLLHMVGLARLGMPLVDGAEVDQLAAVCTELERSTFLLVIAPPRLRGATGIPVNPLAISWSPDGGPPRPKRSRLPDAPTGARR